MAIVLALAAAASWGLADFLAGLASRRISVPVVLLLVEGGGLVVIVVVAVRVNVIDRGVDVAMAEFSVGALMDQSMNRFWRSP